MQGWAAAAAAQRSLNSHTRKAFLTNQSHVPVQSSHPAHAHLQVRALHRLQLRLLRCLAPCMRGVHAGNQRIRLLALRPQKPHVLVVAAGQQRTHRGQHSFLGRQHALAVRCRHLDARGQLLRRRHALQCN